MKLRAALLMTAALALAPALASAETYEGWYGSIGGAYNGLRDSDISGARTGKAEWSAGYGAIGALGYSFGATPLRLEGELGYRRNNLDSVSGLAPAALNGSGSGHVSAYTGMLNLLWDIMPAQRFTPYVGAGVGVAMLSTKGGLQYYKTSDNTVYNADLTPTGTYPHLWVDVNGNLIVPQPSLAYAKQDWTRRISS